MKLNTKRTVFVGFAFFLICAFWQAYDNIIPKILTDKFGMSQAWSGGIMALDNIFALFLLPFFGALSDKCSSRRGKRTPFIFVGTIIAVVLLVCLSFSDKAQLQNINRVTATEGQAYAEALDTLWEANPEIRLEAKSEDGKSFAEILKDINPFRKDVRKTLHELISEEEFKSITVGGEGYGTYVVPARQSYAGTATRQNPTPLIVFVVILLFLLVSMGIFRSPAVALMPDVTVKPLRSKANAIINLMGAAGGIAVLGLGIVFGTGKVQNATMSYTSFFGVVAALMLVSLVLFMRLVKEPKWAGEMQQDSLKYGIEEKEESAEGGRRLTKSERLSLHLILISVALWYMGYNAVTSKYSVYATSVLNKDFNTTLIIAQAAAIVSYIPIGFLSSKFGRRRMILAGVVILSGSFGVASFLRAESPTLLMNVLFALAGIGWATINVNSYPMVVELSRGSSIGKYTGYYYTASMAAQVVTPVLSGIFLDVRFTTLFPYATIFTAAAFFTMLFVRHGDAKPEAKATVLDGIGGGD